MGARDVGQARSIIISCLQRTWGTVFARSMAGVRIARRIMVTGLTAESANGAILLDEATQYQGALDPECMNSPF